MEWLAVLASSTAARSLVIFIGTSVVAAITYKIGFNQGRKRYKTDTLAASIRAFNERQKIDDEVSSTDAYDICIALGGLPDDCEQLRGLVESPKNK